MMVCFILKKKRMTRLVREMEKAISRYIVVQQLNCIWLFVTPWIVALQALLSMGFPRQEYWSRQQFPSPGDLPNTGIKPTYAALAGTFHFPLSHQGSPLLGIGKHKVKVARAPGNCKGGFNLWCSWMDSRGLRNFLNLSIPFCISFWELGLQFSLDSESGPSPLAS